MHETRAVDKVALETQLRDQVDEFLRRGGEIKTASPNASKGSPVQRIKFTRKDDVSIGYKPAERPQPKVEMTNMATKPNAKPAAKPAPAAKAAVPRSPSIDLSALKLESGIPVPESLRGTRSEWVPVLQKMEVGDSYFIEGKSAGDLSYVRKTGKKIGINLVAASVTEGGVSGARLFRVADDGATAEPADDSGL